MNGSVCTRRSFLKGTTGLATMAAISPMSTDVWAAGGAIPTRPLGRTGVHIPVLGLGTASLGYGLSSAQSERIVETALDHGVTYIDTAYNYAHAQKDIGQVMKRWREKAFLATKTHTTDGTVARLQLEESLRLLCTDYVDVVHIHSVGSLDTDRVLRPGGTLDALLKAKDEGLTRFVGISAHDFSPSLLKILRSESIDVAMVPVHFADHETHDSEKEAFALIEQLGIGIVGMRVFGGTKHTRPGGAKSPRLSESIMDLAFRYTLSVPGVACAVIGVYSEEELRQNILRAQRFVPLSASEEQALEEESRKLTDISNDRSIWTA
ncbi:MAG: aldo/keto reductase [bacterium]